MEERDMAKKKEKETPKSIEIIVVKDTQPIEPPTIQYGIEYYVLKRNILKETIESRPETKEALTPVLVETEMVIVAIICGDVKVRKEQ